MANEAEKADIRKVVARLTDHLIRNDYDLIDLDGKPTRWGEWSERFFKTEEGKYEAPLRAMQLLSFLKTAHHITGDAKYAQRHKLVHDWSFAHFPDAEHGEWFGYLHRDGTPSVKLKGNLWKGPFHLPRMLWYCWRLLE